MFVRLSKHLKWVELAADMSARASERERVATRLKLEVESSKKEIRRLTDVIIRMKQEGYGTHTEESTWGSYRFDELEEGALAPVGHEPAPAGGFTDEETAQAEAEIRAELERALGDD